MSRGVLEPLVVEFLVLEHRPDEADHFSSRCDDRDLEGTPLAHAVEELVKAVLSFPRMGDDGGILSALASSERGALR